MLIKYISPETPKDPDIRINMKNATNSINASIPKTTYKFLRRQRYDGIRYATGNVHKVHGSTAKNALKNTSFKVFGVNDFRSIPNTKER